LHRDHLGSITLLTDNAGAVLKRFKFDPWGQANGMAPESDLWNGGAAAWTRGFSGHDHIPQFLLVHMNGRVYDPRLAAFLISDPANSAELNGYIYARNNPLTIRDISGFNIFEDVWHGVTGAVGGAVNWIAGAATDLWHDTVSFVSRNWREIVTVAVVIGVTV